MDRMVDDRRRRTEVAQEETSCIQYRREKENYKIKKAESCRANNLPEKQAAMKSIRRTEIKKEGLENSKKKSTYTSREPGPTKQRR